MIDNTHLILIRHGQIQANLDQRWHGWTDSALTPMGRQQALKVAERLAQEHEDICAIYTSPLQRTYHTAKAIAELLNLELILEPRLREYGIGILEGASFVELRDQHNFFAQIAADPHFAPDQGESIFQVGSRMRAALADFNQRHPNGKVVAVSHGAAMALALADLLHEDWYAWNKYQFQNTGVTEIHMGNRPSLLKLNCVSHLLADGLDQVPTVTNG